MNTRHLDALRKELLALRCAPLPRPWTRLATHAVGGLRAVGFDRSSELLLIVSSAGRGVIDCRTGQKVARDDDDYNEDAQHLEALGIGPLEGVSIRIAGLCGGGLCTRTADGWSLDIVTLAWPVHDVVLIEPSSSLYDSMLGRPARLHKIGSDSELRACGFSSSGQSLVIATASEVVILSRTSG